MRDADRIRLEQAQGYLDLAELLVAGQIDGTALVENAERILRQVGDASRASFEWNLLLGEALKLLSRYDEAVRYLERARERLGDARPTARHVLRSMVSLALSLGWCYKRTGRLDDAIAALEGVVEPGELVHDLPLEALVMYNLSCYYALAGEKEKMIHWLDRALRAEARYRELIPNEPDFDRFREDGDFQRLLGG